MRTLPNVRAGRSRAACRSLVSLSRTAFPRSTRSLLSRRARRTCARTASFKTRRENMHKPTRLVLALVGVLGASSVSGQDSDLARLREEMRELQKNYEERMQALEKRLAEAEARAGKAEQRASDARQSGRSSTGAARRPQTRAPSIPRSRSSCREPTRALRRIPMRTPSPDSFLPAAKSGRPAEAFDSASPS